MHADPNVESCYKPQAGHGNGSHQHLLQAIWGVELEGLGTGVVGVVIVGGEAQQRAVLYVEL